MQHKCFVFLICECEYISCTCWYQLWASLPLSVSIRKHILWSLCCFKKHTLPDTSSRCHGGDHSLVRFVSGHFVVLSVLPIFDIYHLPSTVSLVLLLSISRSSPSSQTHTSSQRRTCSVRIHCTLRSTDISVRDVTWQALKKLVIPTASETFADRNLKYLLSKGNSSYIKRGVKVKRNWHLKRHWNERKVWDISGVVWS